MGELQWRDELRVDGDLNSTYRVFDDGTVVAYGPERDGPRGLWIASAWSKHPVDHDDAVHLCHIAADSPWPELRIALQDWATPEKRAKWLPKQ